MTHKFTNALIEETSPYLLQHAHNPVNWEAWKPEVLERAKNENKPLLISIGYAACHWCHVMERECFEDEAVASYMNEHFINIKIDREERPDVDQIYMDAIQMMSGNGGWPLNIVATPDGRPFWGATYLPKENWVKSLEQLSQLYHNEPERIEEYANDLSNGIRSVNLIENKTDTNTYSSSQLDDAVAKWTGYFDTFLGGYKQAPKFMMPNNLDFLMHYATAKGDKELMKYVDTTLTKMAYGGIFDHIGGGFSRYSVDVKWHVPHFEKMLYDNGQLVSLYAQAFAVTKNPLYRQVIDQTIGFTIEELLDESGGFYSSLDADSLTPEGELEEGAYYVWTETKLTSLLGADFEVFKDYFNINSYGLWEEENYVLIRDKPVEEIAELHGVQPGVVTSKIDAALAKLKEERNTRDKPRLDDKILSSWNGLMLKGLTDAYRYLGEQQYLDLALKNAAFLEREMIQADYSILRNHKEGKSTINGFLEDYATVIEGFIGLYEVSFDEKWLTLAKKLTEYSQKHFHDSDSGMFFFTSDLDASLIRRSIETNDNVISASNSIMAKNLIKLHKLYPDEGYANIADQMVKNVQQDFDTNAQGYANWLHTVLYAEMDFHEIAIVGESYKELGKQLSAHYLPNSILSGTNKDSPISLLQNRYVPQKSLIYVCIEGACKLPVLTTDEVLKQL